MEKKIKDAISIFRPRGPIGERRPNKLDANPGARPPGCADSVLVI